MTLNKGNAPSVSGVCWPVGRTEQADRQTYKTEAYDMSRSGREDAKIKRGNASRTKETTDHLRHNGWIEGNCKRPCTVFDFRRLHADTVPTWLVMKRFSYNFILALFFTHLFNTSLKGGSTGFGLMGSRREWRKRLLESARIVSRCRFRCFKFDSSDVFRMKFDSVNIK